MEYKLPNGEGGVTVFEGDLLSTQSSRRSPTAPRWTEISIYKTVGGQYIIHKVGKTTRDGEVDRHTIHQTGTGRGVIESCQTVDDDETVYLTYPARQALREASELDPKIRDAFLVQRVD